MVKYISRGTVSVKLRQQQSVSENVAVKEYRYSSKTK